MCVWIEILCREEAEQGLKEHTNFIPATWNYAQQVFVQVPERLVYYQDLLVLARVWKKMVDCEGATEL